MCGLIQLINCAFMCLNTLYFDAVDWKTFVWSNAFSYCISKFWVHLCTHMVCFYTFWHAWHMAQTSFLCILFVYCSYIRLLFSFPFSYDSILEQWIFLNCIFAAKALKRCKDMQTEKKNPVSKMILYLSCKAVEISEVKLISN